MVLQNWELLIKVDDDRYRKLRFHIISFMRSKFPIGFVLFVSLIFVGCGDQFLPPVIGQYSFQARTAIDQLLVNAFPSWSPKTNPNQRTEDALRNMKK